MYNVIIFNLCSGTNLKIYWMHVTNNRSTIGCTSKSNVSKSKIGLMKLWKVTSVVITGRIIRDHRPVVRLRNLALIVCVFQTSIGTNLLRELNWCRTLRAIFLYITVYLVKRSIWYVIRVQICPFYRDIAKKVMAFTKAQSTRRPLIIGSFEILRKTWKTGLDRRSRFSEKILIPGTVEDPFSSRTLMQTFRNRRTSGNLRWRIFSVSWILCTPTTQSSWWLNRWAYFTGKPLTDTCDYFECIKCRWNLQMLWWIEHVWQ